MRRFSVWTGLICAVLIFSVPLFAESLAVKDLNRGLQGETINVSEYLTRGKLNIVEFYSPACPFCVALAPKLAELVSQNQGLALKPVNLDRPGTSGIDWQSPLARQYEIRSVPQFKIYDAGGQLVAEGEKARQMVAKLLVDSHSL